MTTNVRQKKAWHATKWEPVPRTHSCIVRPYDASYSCRLLLAQISFCKDSFETNNAATTEDRLQKPNYSPLRHQCSSVFIELLGCPIFESGRPTTQHVHRDVPLHVLNSAESSPNTPFVLSRVLSKACFALFTFCVRPIMHSSNCARNWSVSKPTWIQFSGCGTKSNASASLVV